MSDQPSVSRDTTSIYVRLVRLTLSAVAVAFLGCTTETETPPQPLITFGLALFDGRQLRSETLQGQTVVVNFWASWCKPCLDEMPALQQVWRRYQHKDVVFVGVVFQDDDAAAAQTFLRNAQIDYPNGQDIAGQLATAFQLVGLPNTFILNREGRLVHRFIGPVKGERLSALLDQVLLQQHGRRQARRFANGAMASARH